MAFPALTEAVAKRDEKAKSLRAIFDEAGPDMNFDNIKSVSGSTVEKVEEIRRLNAELDEAGEEVERLKAVDRAAEAAREYEAAGEKGAPSSDDRGGPAKQAKSFGEMFVDSPTFKGWDGARAPASEIDADLKTLFETSAGWAPETTRGPRLVLDAQRPIQVVDIIPQTTTTQTAVTFMEETTFTNAAAETAEGAAKPEAALALTEQTSAVRKIPVWIPVTTEQLEDVPRIQAYLNNRLPFMIRQRLDLQVLSGNGTPPNLRGILNVSGIQTQAKSTDPVPDAVYKAMTKVRVTGQAVPDAAVFHPNDWQDIRLLRTADGVYIWGSPSDPGPFRIWGLRAVEAQAATENTAIVGDFQNFSELAVKKGITVDVSDSHASYFVENKLAVRAEMRAAFVVYRPAAFCTVTGI